MTSTNLLLITEVFLFLVILKLRKLISLLSRGIIKKNAYFSRLDKGKSSDIDVEVSKPMSKPTIREHNKSVFVLTCYLCCVVVILDQIVLCWGKNQNLRLDLLLGILMFLKLFLFVTFVMSLVTFFLIVINWNLSILCFSLGFVMIFSCHKSI